MVNVTTSLPGSTDGRTLLGSSGGVNGIPVQTPPQTVEHVELLAELFEGRGLDGHYLGSWVGYSLALMVAWAVSQQG